MSYMNQPTKTAQSVPMLSIKLGETCFKKSKTTQGHSVLFYCAELLILNLCQLFLGLVPTSF